MLFTQRSITWGPEGCTPVISNSLSVPMRYWLIRRVSKIQWLVGQFWDTDTLASVLSLSHTHTHIHTHTHTNTHTHTQTQNIFFFLQYWGLNPGPSPWATPPALFFCVKGFFWDRVLQTICPGWLWTIIFLISASWVARIIGVSHWHPATHTHPLTCSSIWILTSLDSVFSRPLC
jgi:hypothetical protein